MPSGRGENISEGHSNAMIKNKLTPWRKKEKDKQTNKSTQDSTKKTKN